MTDTLLRPTVESSPRTGVPTLTWKSPTPVRTPFPLPSSGFGGVFPSQSDGTTDTLLPAAVAYPKRGWRKNPSFPIDVRASHTSCVEPSPSSASFLDVGSIPASHVLRPDRRTPTPSYLPPWVDGQGWVAPGVSATSAPPLSIVSNLHPSDTLLPSRAESFPEDGRECCVLCHFGSFRLSPCRRRAPVPTPLNQQSAHGSPSVGVTEVDWAPFTPVRLCRTGALRHPFTTPRRITSRRTGYHDQLLSSRTI